MEEIREFFGSVLGEAVVPLAYVVRENVEIPPGTDPSEVYITVVEEMIVRALPMGTNHMQMTLLKYGVTWRISPRLIIVAPMSNQHNITKMGDALSSCWGITSSDPTTLTTWLQKQNLSLDWSFIIAKGRSGPGKNTCKLMPNSRQCSKS
jgi:hypothetical protein